MVISGTVREFILADIFNLLMQQRVTGRLAIVDGKLEGGVVFKDGLIVGADCGGDNLQTKLYNFLVNIKKIPVDMLNPLFNASSNNLNALATTLVERGFVSSNELKNFAESCVEDISCSLLAWSRGTYRFNPLRSIATIACGAASISVENIIMEGMRRTDEWARMQEYIKGEMIFVPKTAGGAPAEFDVVAAPEEYVLSLLNGSNTVKSITAFCCLCEYRVYESLSILLQTQRIAALHNKYAQPIQAALKRKEAEEASMGKTFFGSVISAGVAVAFVLFFLFCKTSLLPKLGGEGGAESAGVTDAARAAALLYQAVNGEPARNPAVLKNAGLLTNRDF
ncbi:MAG: DUF4388 domain-containing protein [Chitinispirillales bacterium]|jgi:hypothetical protein|nr:DUF4388 domain-containing protein [Chitinispirillales bacterium]